jgi:hypothetical protein
MMNTTPVNFRRQEASPEAIDRDVSYAIQVADSYVSKFPEGAADLAGLAILELGPGPSLGTAVVLACYGARVAVSDRYLTSWDTAYHRPFYEALLLKLSEKDRVVSRDPIQLLLNEDGFVPAAVECIDKSVEELGDLEPATYDIVLSNAVLEHVQDVPRSIFNLGLITAAGGLNVHQVDFRDHRDFDHPLEYLTLDSKTFWQMFTERKGECGNRWRHFAMGKEFERAGFSLDRFTPNMYATAEYLEDLKPRVHSDFESLSDEDLAVLSGCYYCQKQASHA